MTGAHRLPTGPAESQRVTVPDNIAHAALNHRCSPEDENTPGVGIHKGQVLALQGDPLACDRVSQRGVLEDKTT